MGEASLGSRHGKELGRTPLGSLLVVADEDPPGLGAAADVELSFVTHGRVGRAVLARLAAILPLGPPLVAVEAARLVVALDHAGPVVGPGHRVQVTVVHDQRADARRLAVSDASEVGPAL